jgi:twitching motility protein PilT
VGVDTESVAVGLRAALRQDPDVVVVGEVPDLDTLDVALKAAETGRLVLVEMVAPDVAGAITRAQAFFPPEEREIGRLRLAENLRAVSAQQLLPRADGPGHTAAFEVLTVAETARERLRASEAAAGVRELLSASGDGAQPFAADLDRLRGEGRISEESHRIANATQGVVPGRRRGGRKS